MCLFNIYSYCVYLYLQVYTYCDEKVQRDAHRLATELKSKKPGRPMKAVEAKMRIGSNTDRSIIIQF